MSGAKKDDSDLSELLCGCGMPVRYSMPGKEDQGSCNKRLRCPTYGELQEALRQANRRLAAYQKAVNQIDDYFEYAMELKQDQKKVHQILGNLTDAIKAI